MSTAEFTNKLNRRHKAALCSTLICVGLILLLGGAVRYAVGVGLLGLAFSWALGSDMRPVHWLFVICGLLLLLVAVGDGFLWSREKPEEIKSETSHIEAVRANSLIMKEDRQDELFKDEQELESLQAEGIFRHVMKNDSGTVLGGLLLFSAGLGLIIGVNPVRQDQPEPPR